jgi:hypothetical protein
MRRTLYFVAGLTVLLGAVPAQACNIPVFRYALERWRPDPYEMIVVHRGPLGLQEQVLVDSLRKYADSPGCISNFALDAMDLDKADAKDQEKLLKNYKMTQLPWVIVRYPEAADPDGPAWSSPLDAGALRNVLDSPIRRELAKRLLKGESAVWLFLESGDQEKDDQALGELQTSLRELEKTLKLPELTDTPKDKLLREELPLKIAFSVLRLKRTDPNEKVLVHMLRHLEKDLSQTAEPMLFPVFGRGIALYTLVGKGITKDNIAEASVFLTGACSCEVKRLNPGVDLLMTADWEAELEGRVAPAPEVPLVGLLPEPPAGPPATIPVAKCGNVDEKPSSSLLLWTVGGTVAGGLLTVVVLSLVLFKKW